MGKELNLGEQPLKIHSPYWKIQKLGWLIMAIILLAALFGIAGNGLFGPRSAFDENKILSVEYDPFMRSHAVSLLSLKIQAKKILQSSSVLSIWISQKNLHGSILQQISPKPFSEEINNGNIIYRFHVKNNNEIVILNFWIEPQQFGFLKNTLGVVNGPTINYKQMIYP